MILTWDPSVGRYRRENGRIVPWSQVRTALDNDAEILAQHAREIADAANAGTLSLERFRDEMREMIKQTHVTAMAMARGGRDQLGQKDLGKVGATVKQEYRHLDKWVGDISAGKARPTPGRAALYAQAGRQTFEQAKDQNMVLEGMGEWLSVLHPAEHCLECVAEAAAGWRPIGEGIPIGRRTCLNNCHCTARYRRAGPVIEGEGPSVPLPPPRPPEPEPEVIVEQPTAASRASRGVGIPHLPPFDGVGPPPATLAEFADRIHKVIGAKTVLHLSPDEIREGWGENWPSDGGPSDRPTLGDVGKDLRDAGGDDARRLQVAQTQLGELERMRARYPDLYPIDKYYQSVATGGLATMHTGDLDGPIKIRPSSMTFDAERIRKYRLRFEEKGMWWTQGIAQGEDWVTSSTRHELAHTQTTNAALKAWEEVKLKVSRRLGANWDPPAFDKFSAMLGMSPDPALTANFGKHVSEYSISGPVQEQIAEVAAMVSAPWYQPGTLPPEFEDFTQKLFSRGYPDPGDADLTEEEIIALAAAEYGYSPEEFKQLDPEKQARIIRNTLENRRKGI